MGGAEHYRKLERLYEAAPVSRYNGSRVEIGEGRATVRIPIRPEFHHAAAAVHGSLYFRALDDAAFFAVNSLVDDVLVVTVSFTIHFLRPVSEGELVAEGSVVHSARRLFVAQSELWAGGRRIGTGSGSFMRTDIALDPAIGYA
jgi:uncharacterized protein (TIGR00369 family)